MTETIVDHALQREQIALNYDAFQRQLSGLLADHSGEYAVLKDAQIRGFFPSPGDALRAAQAWFADDVFSIQEVTAEPIDLGFFSHVGH